MSIDAAFKDVSHALKNYWEACFLNEENKALLWTKPLITSINTPKLKFIVTPTEGGVMKAYTGYELPENLSITMCETRNRDVEKYLDGWMFGDKGVFDRGKGKFRTRAAGEKSNIYRCIRFTTLFWENADPDKNGTSAGAKSKEPNVKETLTYTKAKENSDLYLKYNDASQQIIPQLTSLVSGAANQALGHIPSMAVGRVVIPPPLIKRPLPWSISLQKTLASPELSIKKRETLKQGNEQEIPSVKNFKHAEKITSTTTYTCAIEGYEVATYDYESGGPVSYTVNLSIINYQTRY